MTYFSEEETKKASHVLSHAHLVLTRRYLINYGKKLKFTEQERFIIKCLRETESEVFALGEKFKWLPPTRVSRSNQSEEEVAQVIGEAIIEVEKNV